MNKTTPPLKAFTEKAAAIVQQVFGSMLGVEVRSAPAAPPAPPGEAPPGVVAAVYFTAGWKGAVLLECAPPQAYAFTAKLMSIPKPSRVDDDVRDALGELTNIIAGNLKAALPKGVELSMPSVVEGGDFTHKIVGANECGHLAFDSAEGAFALTLVRMLDK